MKTGLFFGSFNPIHVGHLIIANHVAQWGTLKEVWFVVSPHNPLKDKKSLAKDYVRLDMVHLAIEGNDFLKASDIEFKLPKPSYTVDTLVYLREKYPQREFSLIMGGDNLLNFRKWKKYKLILEHHDILVYNRLNYELGDLQYHQKVSIVDAPNLEISASHVRSLIRQGKSVRYLVTDPVLEYLEHSGLYQR